MESSGEDSAQSSGQSTPWIACDELDGHERELVGNAEGLKRLAAAIDEALSKGRASVGVPDGRVCSVALIDLPRSALRTMPPTLKDWIGGALSLAIVSGIFVGMCLVMLQAWRWIKRFFF